MLVLGPVALAFSTRLISAKTERRGRIENPQRQILLQLYGIGVTIAYCAVASFIILKVVDVLGFAKCASTRRSKNPVRKYQQRYQRAV